MGALSKRNDDPAGASRPFDANRDGFVFGEAAGVMVIEAAEHAEARGAAILAEVAGGALTGDAFHISAPDPSGYGATLAMQRAIRDAHLELEQVDYVVAHGTSTPLNDATETKAIRAAFGAHADRLAVSSNKSMVGHTLGAAGAISALAAVLAIRDGVVPPTINHETPDPGLRPRLRAERGAPAGRSAWRSSTASGSAARTRSAVFTPLRGLIDDPAGPRYGAGTGPSIRSVSGLGALASKP